MTELRITSSVPVKRALFVLAMCRQPIRVADQLCCGQLHTEQMTHSTLHGVHHTVICKQEVLPFEPGSIVRLITAFQAHTVSSNAEDQPSIEEAGSLLWDISADPDATDFLLQANLLPAILSQVQQRTTQVHDAHIGQGVC